MYKLYHRLTEEQQDSAWTLLNMGGDNRDKTIAKRLGCNVRDVRIYLAERSHELLERVNNKET